MITSQGQNPGGRRDAGLGLPPPLSPPPHTFLAPKGHLLSCWGRGVSLWVTLNMNCSIYLLLHNQSPNNSSSKQHPSPYLPVSVGLECGKRSLGGWGSGPLLWLQLALGCSSWVLPAGPGDTIPGVWPCSSLSLSATSLVWATFIFHLDE